ncbi:hypothetical protein QFC19_006349 [Naganishia cerealis]|uniref:Uncharacterized protein n=1 Tax=Naganishia cerealis TaxID=610337 RepID=A0ACC2VGS5_9TREE|nr:hypothetical protein QFC19_006349 [Naganishia cerealis]
MGSASDQGDMEERLGSSKFKETTEDLTNSTNSLSASTISALSSNTATPRPRTKRTLSRPKWLDVDANGGLLRRKTEPAVAAVTVKGLDTIQSKRNGKSPVDPEMETIPRQSSSFPGKGNADALHQLFQSQRSTTPVERRRTIGIAEELARDDEGSDERPSKEQGGYMGSPEQVPTPLHPPNDSKTAGPALESTSSLPELLNGSAEEHSANDTVADIARSATDVQLAIVPDESTVAQPKNVAAVLDSGIGTDSVASPDSTDVSTSQNLQADSGSTNVANEPEYPLGFTLRQWGTWMYSCAPAILQPLTSPSSLAVDDNNTLGTESAPALLDPEQQFMEANIYETIGTVPDADFKDQIYNISSADNEAGTQTEQGIGVDPQHRSEVPEAPKLRPESEHTGAWSVSALASSAWAWRRGRGTTDAQIVKDEIAQTTEASEASPFTAPEPSEESQNLPGEVATATTPEASLQKADGGSEAVSTTPTLPPPGWSGYVGSWLRKPQAAPIGEAASSTNLIDANSENPGASIEDNVSDTPKMRPEQGPDHTDSSATSLVSLPVNTLEDAASPKSNINNSSPSRGELSGLNTINEAYMQEQTADTSRLSRTAWALSTASRWVNGRGPAMQPGNQVPVGDSGIQNAGIVNGVHKEQLQLNKEQVPATPNNAKSPESERYRTAAYLDAAAQSDLLTPEVLEARPSPLLPSAASMLSRPNLVLPSFNHTFSRPPRGYSNHSSETATYREDYSRKLETMLHVPFTSQRSPPNMAWRALGAVSQYARGAPKESDLDLRSIKLERAGSEEPEKKALPLLANSGKERWDGIRRVVIIGVHGWFPNAHVQKVIGAPRGSSYFASMMGQAVLAQFEADFGVGQEAPEKVTYIPLDGEGPVEVRVEKLYKAYLSRTDWVSDIRRADAIFVAAHSQGTIVAAHLISRLIAQGHICTTHNTEAVARCEWAFGPVIPLGEAKKGERNRSVPWTSSSTSHKMGRLPKVGLLAMCGVHQGPFYSTTASTVIQPYLNWFEGGAARELYDFQDNNSTASKEYVKSLDLILHHGVKTIFLASLDDQMVPIYSATFTAATHPLILRLLYVDAAIHSSTDFMINLIVFCLMLRNAGLDDQGLITHLSEANAGAWRGAGHSTPYEDPGAYAFMVKYLLSTTVPDPDTLPRLQVEDYVVKDARNDYELPWILRGVMDDPEVKLFFDAEISELKENILDWQPTTRALKDIKKRLEPMAGRAALRLHQQKHRLRRTSSFLSLASSDGQISARKQEASLSSSPSGEIVQRTGPDIATTSGKL